MSDTVIVWDLETMPDLAAAGRALGHVGEPDEGIRAELGDGFPKLPLHSIVCIGASVASRRDDGWAVSRGMNSRTSHEQTGKSYRHAFSDVGPSLGQPRAGRTNHHQIGNPTDVLRYLRTPASFCGVVRLIAGRPAMAVNGFQHVQLNALAEPVGNRALWDKWCSHRRLSAEGSRCRLWSATRIAN